MKRLKEYEILYQIKTKLYIKQNYSNSLEFRLFAVSLRKMILLTYTPLPFLANTSCIRHRIVTDLHWLDEM